MFTCGAQFSFSSTKPVHEAFTSNINSGCPTICYTPVALPSSAVGVLTSPGEVVPTPTKAIPLENPPDSCLPSQDQGFAEETGTHATCDPPNGLADALEVSELKEPNRDESTLVSHDDLSAGLPPPEKSDPTVECPIISPGLQNLKEPLTTENDQNLSFVTAEEPTSQADTQMGSEAQKSSENPEMVAEKPVDSQPSGGPVKPLSSDALTAVEDLTDVHLDTAQDEVLPDEVTIEVLTENENLEKKEPVILLSKAIQSEGNTKNDAPPLSTSNLSGWFAFCENWVHSPPCFCSYALNQPSGLKYLPIFNT